MLGSNIIGDLFILLHTLLIQLQHHRPLPHHEYFSKASSQSSTMTMFTHLVPLVATTVMLPNLALSLSLSLPGLLGPRIDRSAVPDRRLLEDTTYAVNSTTCNGQFYAYTQLAGYGYISGNATDKFGDTIGGIGSAISLDQSSWTRSADGLTYQGVLWAQPDRGW